MSDKWLQCYIYGDYNELLAWLVETWPCTEPDCVKPYIVPHNAAFRGNYLFPQRKSSTVKDEYGQEHDVYELIPERSDIVCLIAVTDRSLLEGIPGIVHFVSKEEIKGMYPDHCPESVCVPYII